jgi:hypothetical protein
LESSRRTLFSSSSSTSNRNLDHRHHRRGSCGGGVGSKAALFFELSHFSVSFVKDVYILRQILKITLGAIQIIRDTFFEGRGGSRLCHQKTQGGGGVSKMSRDIFWQKMTFFTVFEDISGQF